MSDLFDEYEKLPQYVKDIFDKYSDEDNTYEVLETMKRELEGVGYTFDYYLDAEPINLRKINS